jgi:hypothetical protein
LHGSAPMSIFPSRIVRRTWPKRRRSVVIAIHSPGLAPRSPGQRLSRYCGTTPDCHAEAPPQPPFVHVG